MGVSPINPEYFAHKNYTLKVNGFSFSQKKKVVYKEDKIKISEIEKVMKIRSLYLSKLCQTFNGA